MKTKITLLVMEVLERPRTNGVIPLKILVDNRNVEPIYKYISTKSEMDTISELLLEYSNLEITYCYPELVDFIHEKSSDECEVVYTVKLPSQLIKPKRHGELVEIEQSNLKERYVRSIERTPRSIVCE